MNEQHYTVPREFSGMDQGGVRMTPQGIEKPLVVEVRDPNGPWKEVQIVDTEYPNQTPENAAEVANWLHEVGRLIVMRGGG